MLTSLLVAVVLAAPPTIEMVNATSNMGARSGTWLYGPENLFDGRDDTAWCVGVHGDAVGERIAVEFSAPIRATEIRIAPGDSRKFGSFWPANRPEVLSISNGSYVWQVFMPDDPDPFQLPVPPPITGRYLVLRIDSSHMKNAKTTCVAEIGFVQDGKPIRPVAAIRQAGPGSFEGVWVEEGKDLPELFVTFLRDGRMRAHEEPVGDRAAAPKASGTWRRDANGKLTMTLNGEPETVRAHLRAHAPDGRARLIMDGRFKGTWVRYVPQLSFQVKR